MILPKIFFGYFAFMILALSLLVITRRNPVHSIILMLALFFHISGLYLMLNAEFLAAVQMIVYAGAILVLFLFVILMLNIKTELQEPRYIGIWPTAVVLAAAISAILFSSLLSIPLGRRGTYTIEAIAKETHTVALGKLLYTDFLFPFEIASAVLLVALIGAIVLAKKHLRR